LFVRNLPLNHEQVLDWGISGAEYEGRSKDLEMEELWSEVVLNITIAIVLLVKHAFDLLCLSMDLI
jgi:hypothetical protein